MGRAVLSKYHAKNGSVCFARVLVAGLFLAACRSGAGGLSVTASSSPQASQATSPQASQATAVVLGSGPMRVTITSPADETVVAVPQVDVAGQAPPETVITINDTIVVVGATGQ